MNAVQTSPLLALPGELRNHIFSFLIESGPPPSPKLLGSTLDSKIAKSNFYPIFQTCPQVRVEAKGFLSSKVEFSVQQAHMLQICQRWIPSGTLNATPIEAYGCFAIAITDAWNGHDVLPILCTYLAASSTQHNLHFRYYTPYRSSEWVYEVGTMTRILSPLHTWQNGAP